MIREYCKLDLRDSEYCINFKLSHCLRATRNSVFGQSTAKKTRVTRDWVTAARDSASLIALTEFGDR